jgi:AcrR family transcriptional regulator
LNLRSRGMDVEDRRKQIIDAGLALLREEGLAGLTQPRIAARTGLRQSHLTYYYPTRAALLAAVARAAIDLQGEAAHALTARIRSIDNAPDVIAEAAGRHANTRVLVALNQAAEQEPEVRALFNELSDNFFGEIVSLFDKLGLAREPAHVDLLHALFVGLSVIDLATCRPDQRARSKAALDVAFASLAAQGATKAEPVPMRKARNSKKAGV